MKNVTHDSNKLIFAGFLHALGIAVYVSLVVLVIQNGDKIFGQMNNFWGPVAFLLLFILSAAVTGALALGQPIILFLENKKTEAVKLFGYVVAWLFILTLITLLIQIAK